MKKVLLTIYIIAWIISILCILTYGTSINPYIVTINVISLVYIALFTYANTRR